MNNRILNDYITKIRSQFSDIQGILMEVCGTHTNVIRKAGIQRLLPPGLKLLSGPGCPVCVTGSGFIEQAIQLSRNPKMIIATFGDLLKVPGNTGTLTEARAEGSPIRVVYSPSDALELARVYPGREVVFLGVGFETTVPVIGLAVKEAEQSGINNFSVLPALKILNPAMRALLKDRELKINGLIAPGHLSVITGAKALAFLPQEFGLPTVITGFELEEIWLGIASLLFQIKTGVARLENRYPKAVSDQGNRIAQNLIGELFQKEPAEWRGLGTVDNSGLGFKGIYEKYDARVRYQLEPVDSLEPPGCKCGQIILGKAEPEDCGHFGSSCTPDHPVGPCMVSSEGVCAAYFYYRQRE
jgi:hydrogenase expression/formation protein HypD